ncbi:UNVERIFIED_CONTAM: hypothetical protein FKN15_075153 [Acipenser sinensis]
MCSQADRFFSHCRLTMQPPKSYSVRGQRSSRAATGKPAGTWPDYRGRWCAVQLTATTPALTREQQRRIHAVLQNVCCQPTVSFHSAGPPCSQPRATASQVPGQSTGVTGAQSAMQPTQSYSVAGARTVYRGHWCTYVCVDMETSGRVYPTVGRAASMTQIHAASPEAQPGTLCDCRARTDLCQYNNLQTLKTAAILHRVSA